MSDNNIPAFPLFKTFPGDDGEMVTLVQPGMTMRQWYKSTAPDMPLWWLENFNSTERIKATQNHSYIMRGQISAMCKWRGAYADAMLAEDADAMLRAMGGENE
jgi:hypothetical protein